MPPPRRITAGRALSCLVFALAGLLFWTSYDSAHGGQIRPDQAMLRLSDLIRQQSTHNSKVEHSVRSLRATDDAAARKAGTDPATRTKIDTAGRAAGTAKLTGDALSVTLNDAPPDATALEPGIAAPQPDDLVIHQQDVQSVVNALWRGGAKGIEVMDRRIVSTGAVRCVGNTLLLQGQVYAPPYTITAVGDVKALRKALLADPSTQNYLLYVKAYGLGWKVAEPGTRTLPAYTGPLDLRYAKPVG